MGLYARWVRRIPRLLAAPLGLATGLALLAGLPQTVATAEAATPKRQIDYRQWTGDTLAQGRFNGTKLRRGGVVLGKPIGRSGGYERGAWVSKWTAPGFSLTELIPSWHANTPGSTWVRIDVRGRTADRTGSWDTVASWARDDRDFTRRTGPSQTDDLGRVLYDTWLTPGVTSWQVRVTLHRKVGGTKTPRLHTVGAVVSRLPSVSTVRTSKPGAERGAALGKVLRVPTFSQMVHRGSYPQYGGGGQAWCSPTSTAMVLGYYKSLPPPSAYSWVRQGHPDPVVPHLARQTYDSSYGGTGTWPFNTAFAATRTGNGFVTRLRSLREAERFIAAGIPLIASVTFGSGQLSGAPISSTNGHLMVIVGFRKNGDVVVNDPAASSNSGVRRVYDRGQFENVWLRRNSSGGGGSGGLVYVIHDDAHPVPNRVLPHNW
jgi:hypothetical protein